MEWIILQLRRLLVIFLVIIIVTLTIQYQRTEPIGKEEWPPPTNNINIKQEMSPFVTKSCSSHIEIQTYGGGKSDMAHSVIQTADNGFILVGSTESYDGEQDMWLVKTDVNGLLQWDQVYGESAWDCAYSVLQTEDGGLILSGFTWIFRGGDLDGAMWLVKTDANGTLEWDQTYSGLNEDSANAYSVIQTVDNGFIIAGWTESYGAGSFDIWLVKTDVTGKILWNHTYGGLEPDVAESLIQTADGGFLLAGYTASYGSGSLDMCLVKTDADGINEWTIPVNSTSTIPTTNMIVNNRIQGLDIFTLISTIGILSICLRQRK